MNRQKIRKTILLISFLLFPITIWYFSPYLIIQATFQHILNGSFFVFMAMLIFSIFAGRIWCGYFCPAGGLQEYCATINEKPAKQGWKNQIKYILWIIWIIVIISIFLIGSNPVTINFFYMTKYGISIHEVMHYIIYYVVLIVLFLPSLIHGKRATCHYLCWMAPFMVIGSSFGKTLHVPQLHIELENKKCISCKKCNKICPMGLNVDEMMKKDSYHTECIQCGACVDICRKNALKYKFLWNKN